MTLISSLNSLPPIAFQCPGSETIIELFEGSGENAFNIDISPNPNNKNPEDGFRGAPSPGTVDISPNEEIVITSQKPGDTFRVMDVQFTADNADEVVVTLVFEDDTTKDIPVPVSI